VGAAPAAANFVVNGGFETGHFAGFEQFGNSSSDGVTREPTYVNSGLFGAQFGSVGSTSGIRQTVKGLTAGQTYTLSYALANLSNGGGHPLSPAVVPATFDSFEAVVDGATLFPSSTFQRFRLRRSASRSRRLGTTTELQFEFRNDSALVESLTAAAVTSQRNFALRNGKSYFGFDDVSVVPAASPVPTPAPASAVVLLATSAGLGVVRRRRAAFRT